MPNLLINASGFPPQIKNGGPAKSIFNLVNVLKENFGVTVIASNFDEGSTDKIIEKDVLKKEKLTVFYVDYKHYKIKNIYKIIKKSHPDIIYQNSIFNYKTCLPALYYCKKQRKKCVLATRGELSQNALSFKKIFKLAYLFLVRLFLFPNKLIFHATSDQESKDIKNQFKKGNVVVIPNLPSSHVITKVYERDSVTKRFYYLGRIHKIKNLDTVLLSLKNIKSSLLFDIYGPIEDLDYWEHCKEIIELLPENIKVNYCGIISPNESCELPTKYDCLIMPSFSENFGHSIVEAMMCKKIVIVTNNTPWTLVKENGGFVCDPYDSKTFTEAIECLLNMPTDELEKRGQMIYAFINNELSLESSIKKYFKMFDLESTNA